MAQSRQQEKDHTAVMQTAAPETPPVARQGMPEPVAATVDESPEQASSGDDRQSVEEGAGLVHETAPGLHSSIPVYIEGKDGKPVRIDPRSITIEGGQFSVEYQEHPKSSALTTEQVAQGMTPEEQAFWDNSPADAPQLMGEAHALQTVLSHLPAAERSRFQTWCKITKVNEFAALLAIVQQAVYRPEAMQRAKSMLFSGQSMAPSAGPVLTGSPVLGMACGYCGEPIVNGREGQKYHAGQCGAFAAGKQPVGESYFVDSHAPRQQQDTHQLQQFEQEQFTVPQHATALTPLAVPEGFCSLCTRPIESVRDGQRYHDGPCGALATGRPVPGADSFLIQVQRDRAAYQQRQGR